MKVISLVERNGEKRSFHVADVTAATVKDVLQEQVAKKSRLMTDEAAIYTQGRRRVCGARHRQPQREGILARRRDDEHCRVVLRHPEARPVRHVPQRQ